MHVSGHSPAGELLYLLNVVKPSNFMPVHGEWRHLRAHARLAIESGVAEDRVVICEDGDVVDLVDGRARIVGHVKSRYVYVDGLAVGDVGESLLTERRILGDGGFIACTVVVDSVTGKVVGGPTVSAKGFTEDPVDLRRGAAGGHRGARPGRRSTASPIRTSCSRWSAARSAAGSTTRTGGAR